MQIFILYIYQPKPIAVTNTNNSGSGDTKLIGKIAQAAVSKIKDQLMLMIIVLMSILDLTGIPLIIFIGQSKVSNNNNAFILTIILIALNFAIIIFGIIIIFKREMKNSQILNEAHNYNVNFPQ
jgi:hypothetical protein